MTRQTSIDAYREAIKSGLVGRKQAHALRIISEHGPMTSNEVFNVMRREAEDKGDTFNFDSNTRARMTELREAGLIYETGTVRDPFTNRTVIQWEIVTKPTAGQIRMEF